MTSTPFTKEQALAKLERAKRHYAADTLIKGTYGRTNGSFKGCSIGCELSELTGCGDIEDAYFNRHSDLADLTGVPEWLLHLQDRLFEGLPDGENRDWHVQIAQALVDAHPIDFDGLLHRIHTAILRVAHRAAGESRFVVERVSDLHERALHGDVATAERATADAAEAAALAARTAAEATARTAAGPTAWAWSAAWFTALETAYQKIRDDVLEAIAQSTARKG
jgi:hypothetical protein